MKVAATLSQRASHSKETLTEVSQNRQELSQALLFLNFGLV